MTMSPDQRDWHLRQARSCAKAARDAVSDEADGTSDALPAERACSAAEAHLRAVLMYLAKAMDEEEEGK